MREHIARRPWAATAASWSILSSHDTARIRTIVRTRELQEVAAGLLFTLVGAPMVFAGDEIGLTGTFGEDARTPFPWHRPDSWDRPTLGVYRSLAALRRGSTALRHGGLRWLAATGDALAFLREGPHERLLVLAARCAGDELRLPAGPLGVTRAAPNVYGGAPQLVVEGNSVALPGDGPTFQVWRLD
jgi:alpha-glucosidase